MSDDDTLTLRATGSAEATTTHEDDGRAVTTTVTADVEATLDIDGAWIREHWGTSKRGVTVRPDEVAAIVCDCRSDEATTFTAIDPREWDLRLDGAFEAWTAIAVGLAKRQITVGSDDRIANVTCRILDDLAVEAVDDRPRLVMLDIVGSYDPADYTRASVLAELAPDAESPAATPTAEATADD